MALGTGSSVLAKREPGSCTLALALLFAMFAAAPAAAQSNAQGGNNASDNGVNNGLGNTTEDEIVDDLINNAANNGRGNGNGDGNGNQFCQIIVVDSGSLGSGFENDTLSSKTYGGKSGSAQVTTSNGSYSLSIDPPLGFTVNPAGGNQNITMKTSFLGNGVTNFSETPGTIDIRLKRGLTVVDTHLTAQKTDGNPFPAGFYSAEVTLRCE